MQRILIFGYGNPGRQDDGLGIRLAQNIEEWVRENNYRNISIDTNYQLNIENAYNLNDFDIVVFADASKENIKSYKFEAIKPIVNPRFSMHSVSPEFVIGLCSEMYGNSPKTYVLHIKGYEWEFMKEPTKEASQNLSAATVFLKNKIKILNKD